MRPADLLTPIAVGVVVLLGWANQAILHPWYWLAAVGAAAVCGILTWLYGATKYRHGILDEMIRDRHVEPDEDTPADGFV